LGETRQYNSKETAVKAAQHPDDARALNFINGEYRTGSSGKTFENISPVDGSLVSVVHEADASDVDAAVRAARAALDGP
jgi:hypothetical protein